MKNHQILETTKLNDQESHHLMIFNFTKMEQYQLKETELLNLYSQKTNKRNKFVLMKIQICLKSEFFKQIF